MAAFETSEGPEKTATKPKNWIKFGCIIPSIALGILLLVGLVYYGIGYILVKQIDSRYAGRDCTSLVDLVGSVEKVYPLKIAPFTEPALEQARECQAYLSAESLHQQKSWEKAYQAYVKYGQVYPKGIYTKEARELAADALFEWASTQHGSQDFANSVDNLTLLLNNYGDTPSMPKAKEVLPVVYLEWGEECRANGEFSEAESVYISMNEWAVQEGDQAYATRAQAELSQAYFDWGKALQNEKNFTLAATKLDKAMSTDPDAKSANSLTAQTRAYLPGFQRAWGEYLIANGNYSEAIGHYQTSISLSSAKDAESAKNELTQAYLEWAAALRKKEDYNQALDKVNLADESAVTDTSRGKAEDERATTISQFSQSKGTQAKKIISDTVKSICTDGKPIEAPPIIGVLDEKRLTVSGLSLNLPSNVLAQAPGNLYFVACTAEKEVTVQSCPFSRTGYGIATHWIKRIRYDWQFKIYNSQTGKLYREKTFAGSSPESCPYSHSFSTTTHYHYGDKPSTTTVVDWLASLLK